MAYNKAGERNVTFSITKENYGRFKEFCEKYNSGKREAYNTIMEKGFEAIEAEESGLPTGELTKTIKKIESQIGEIHKSSGQAAQASLSMMIFLSFMGPFIFDASMESLNERNSENAEWFNYMYKRTNTPERFAMWWNTAGKFRRDIKPDNILPSMKEIENIIEGKHTIKKLLGIEPDVWSRAMRRKNDDMKHKH